MFEREFAKLDIYLITGQEHSFENGRIEGTSDFIVIFDSENNKDVEFVLRVDLINMMKITKKLKDINQ